MTAIGNCSHELIDVGFVMLLGFLSFETEVIVEKAKLKMGRRDPI